MEASNKHISTSFSLDDILQREDGPLCAAEIGSELQKQFAILPGWSNFFACWLLRSLGMWSAEQTNVY